MEEKENDSSQTGRSSKKTNGLNESLIKFNNVKHKLQNEPKNNCRNCLECIFPCMKQVDTQSRRHVFFSDKILNQTPYSNEVLNHKYNLISFIPVVLFNQFKLFGNFFYLLMTITQFIDELKVGFLFSYLSPLVIVVGVSMIKELYDDINRRIQDKKTNGEIYKVYRPSADAPDKFVLVDVQSKDLVIGDIVELQENQRVPADMVLLKTFNESGDNHSFIRTDQLDGETDWKLRKAPGLIQVMEINDIMNLQGYIEYQPPSKHIYNFEGVIEYREGEGEIKKEALGLENTVWASTILASKKIIGIVIFTGDETRARMNSSVPKIKTGVLDKELNMLNVYLFIIMVILSIILTYLKKPSGWTILFVFFRFIVLFCGIIPISLRVNLDISKTFFSLLINRDETIKDTIARNSTIPEELGRITYVFSDKTGTLTKNEMIFKTIAMESDVFTEESFNDLSLILQDECKASDAPLVDLINADESSVNTSMLIDEKKPKRKRRPRTKIIRDTITTMVLCNNVTPIIEGDNPEDYSKITYQASSPDEVALVKFAEKLNMKLVYRTDTEIKIQNAIGVMEEYDILANFPFSSDTKRMGIVLRNRKHGHIIFYMKGAENVIEKFVKEEYKGYIKENAENLATKGLRTLVLTQKIIQQDFYDQWAKEYNEALTSMENRKEKIAETVSKLENNMDFLCVTGVEDLLQDDVNTTLENLRNAGMKIWMLTGDKVETATCISISAGLKAKNHKIFTIRFDGFEHISIDEDTNAIKALFTKFQNCSKDPHILIIDGDSLDLALNHCEKEFFETAMKAPAVVCCRCSPTQKRIIVKTIKKYTDKRTAAVGDGGNDVAMIQEADVGIGIVGKEGLQASLAADFSILKFNYLNTLLLWWGRLSYKNTSSMANFVIHRGLIISLIQFVFSLMFYFNAVALYNGVLILGYSTIYTTLPSISVLLDRDTDLSNVMKFPALYKALLRGRELSMKNFLWWVFKSIFQAGVIMFCAIFLFPQNIYLKIVTVTFSVLIFVEILNVYTEIQKFHIFMTASLIGTAVTYTLTLVFFPSILDVYFIFELDIIWRIALIAVICWFPFYLCAIIKKKFFPEEYEKLNLAVAQE